MQAVDAARLVKDVLKVMQLSIPSSVSVQTAASGRCMVMGDPMRLHRALLNVLTNSIQSMEKGAGRLLISVQSVNLSGDRSMTTGVLRPGTWVSIAVEDTGAGMSSSVLDRIFEPFFTTKKEGEGTGIGLTGTLRIIDEHRGVIDVSSSPGQGTRFHIYLPAARENPDDVTEPEEGVPCCG